MSSTSASRSPSPSLPLSLPSSSSPLLPRRGLSMDSVRSSNADQLQLARLGHRAELKRTFSPLAMLGLAFAILNSWTALSASLSLALPSGGTVSVMWGLLTAGVCNMCLAASLAEFLSAYPTAGGQYAPLRPFCAGPS